VEILSIKPEPAASVLLEPAPEDERRNVLTAWLLSAICPGMGQLYCGHQTRGWVTCFVFWIAFAYTAARDISSWQFRFALRYVIAMWCFATLDAFFSAQEINSGMAPLVEGANPRVAAILNLMTKGWGYFYLGRKGAGIATFLVLLAADATLRTLRGQPARIAYLAAELVLLALSVHAYYLGSVPLREKVAPVLTNFSDRLSVGVPLVTAAFAASVYLSLVILGASLPDYTKIDQSKARTISTTAGTLYQNLRYGVSVRFPSGWEVTNSVSNEFTKGIRPGGRCIVQFMAVPEVPYFSMSHHFRQLAKTLKAKGDVFDTERETAIGGFAAHEVTFRKEQDETEIDTSFAELRKGLSIYVVVTSSDSDTRSKCEALSDDIKSSVRLR
jgi:TM2 domain-containing membrane protein YozV